MKKVILAMTMGIFFAGCAANVSAGTYSTIESDWETRIPQNAPSDSVDIIEDSNGNHYMKLKGFGQSDTANFIRAYVQIDKQTESYKMSCKYKTILYDWQNNIRISEFGGGPFAPFNIGAPDKSWSYTELEDGWQKAAAGVWADTSTRYFNVICSGWGLFCLDDVLITTDGGTILFYDDFETEIANVTQDENSISWEIPDGANYKKLNVYRTDDKGNRTLVKTLDYGVKTLSKDEIETDFDGTWQLKPVKDALIDETVHELEMNGEKISILKDYEVRNMGLFENAKELNELKTGTFSAQAVVRNNKVTDGVKAQVIAMLKKDGIRVDAWASDVVTAPMNMSDTIIKTDVTIPDITAGGYELYIYLWDSIEGMKIISENKLVTQNN